MIDVSNVLKTRYFVAVWILLLMVLICCQNVTNSTKPRLIPKNKDFKYAIKVTYTGDSEVDTMFVNMLGSKLLVTPEGKVFKSDSLLFDLKPDDMIEQLWFIPIDSDFVAVFVDTDNDYAGGVAERISIKDNKIVWIEKFGGFNMTTPVIADKYAYLSTIGFIGKLNLENGKFDWSFDQLYDKGKYNNFELPEFFENDIVLFKSKQYNSTKPDTILIDEKLKRIIRKN